MRCRQFDSTKHSKVISIFVLVVPLRSPTWGRTLFNVSISQCAVSSVAIRHSVQNSLAKMADPTASDPIDFAFAVLFRNIP